MDHRAISPVQREAMLRAVGVSRVDELFADIPEDIRLDAPLSGLPEALSEMQLASQVSSFASANMPASGEINFMGSGSYDHYTPSVVDTVLSKPEFFTAYTPYQPEVSQGTLQAIFEFQTIVCELTGMEVANAGMYDGATALVEAALMSARVTKRHKVLASATIDPQWLQTLSTYGDLGVLEVEFADLDDLTQRIDDSYACLLVANPDYLGRLTDLDALAVATHDVGAQLVVSINPLLQALLETPGSHGADIVVGEGQPLGLPMSFGGPGIGLFSCRMKHVRQMPGRIAGRAHDVDGKKGFVLTLSTREQHIRRERATSNICSNQTLCATAVGAYCAALGKTGLIATARLCVEGAHYLHDRLLETGLFSPVSHAPFGYEFTLAYKEGDGQAFIDRMRDSGVLAGVAPSGVADHYDPSFVTFAVTEKRTKADIDYFVSEVGAL